MQITNKDDLLLFLLDYLDQKKDFVFLWNGWIDSDNYRSYLFTSPVKLIQCFNKYELVKAFQEMEMSLKNGYYLAGFISYEAGLCLENVFSFVDDRIRHLNGFPLLWFGVYEKPIIYDHGDKCFYGSDDELQKGYEKREVSYCHVYNINNTVSRDEYIADVESVRNAIARGETYQVNYTFKHKFDYDGNEKDLFFELCMNQSASYSAFIRCLNMDILSLSPELFFRRASQKVIVKPMKGTIKRGFTNSDDRCKSNELYNSIKNRAENVMIVDLLRNDLGRISRTGSVEVARLFKIEKYETLFQMTSTVQSELRDNLTLLDFFKSMFPSGSVTGAPKISTMRIINSLEKEPRGVYTGSIGYIAPDNNAVFNVAIRTVVLDRISRKGEMGIGSGIVYDSDAESEFDECLLKANFLTQKYADFQLIETILWQDGFYYLLELHLKRLADSAEYFQFVYDKDSVIQALKRESMNLEGKGAYRVRLLLHRNGRISISSSKLDSFKQGTRRVTFSGIRTDPDNRFLYHKTTNRKIYDSELQKARAKGYYDILFLNNRDEVTEGAISNVFVLMEDGFYTPPIACGLLNGVFRRHLLESDPLLTERVLFKEDILSAKKIYLANSVRGMVEVNIAGGVTDDICQKNRA